MKSLITKLISGILSLTFASIISPTSTFALTNIEASSDYFSHTLFAGDSIMVGFKNALKETDSPIKEASFYCIGGYGVRTAIRPIELGDIHPLYDNQIVNLWTAAQDKNIERLYLMFGLNDIGVTGVETACSNYVSLIDNVLETRPDMEIIVLSTTSMLPGIEYPNLTNENIAQLNMTMKDICDEHDWTFLDVASSLNDQNGNLLPEYCSDGALHLNNSAYINKLFPLISHNKIWSEESIEKLDEEPPKSKHKEMTVLIL